MAADLEVVRVSRGPDHAFASAGRFFCAQWTELPGVDALERLGDAQADHLEAVGEMFTMTILHEVTRPSEDVRAAAVRLAKRFPEGSLVAQTFVLPRDGFAAAMIRMSITGILLMAGNPAGQKVCRSLDEGVRWLREQGAHELAHVDTRDIRAALHELP